MMVEATGKTTFVSYSHQDGDWVWGRLVPVLKAGGITVLIDRERFTAGRALFDQMDTVQDQAEVNLLILSPAYLSSGACLHEMERAIARDSRFENGVVVPVLRGAVTLPSTIGEPNPLYVNLSVDADSEPWDLLLGACGARLGSDAPAWLAARDDTARFLKRGQSVNLVVQGEPPWRELLADLRRTELADLAQVDLCQGATASRRGLVIEILRALGMAGHVPPEPDDLGELERRLATRDRSRLALTHFDMAAQRTYGVDFFAALRYMVMDSRQLVLLVQSRQPFMTLAPAGHPLSEMPLQIVELRGRR